MEKRLTLILGGARGGKSEFAQALARQRGGDDVLFVATAEALDDEMHARIQDHRAARPAGWRTLQAPRRIACEMPAASESVVLVDCMTLWVSNVLLAEENMALEVMLRELGDLLEWYRTARCEMIVVSNEVGMGIVPDNALGRAYRDLLGVVNKRLAEVADEVFLLVAGLPIEIKSRAVRLEDM